MSTVVTPENEAVAPAVDEPAPAGRPLPLWYSSTVAGLVAVATVYGLVTRPYRLVPDMLATTWVAQDAVTLATAPLLVWAAVRAAKRALRAHVLWVGLQTWIAYCYAHLAIGAPLNSVFLVYVALLALAGYGMLDGILRVDVTAAAPAFERAPRRAAMWFLTAGGIGIAGLWLSDIVPALLRGDLPAGIHLGELPNPTWVLDLVWIIPVSIGAAVMVRRGHPAAPLIAAVMLVALLVLSVGMLAIAPFAVATGLQADAGIAAQLVVFSVVFGVLGAVEAWLLVTGARRMGPAGGRWLREGWWT
jgi:hypothetical protein